VVKILKVMAINSSPKMDKGITSLILTPFLEGMKEVGADIELFYTKKLDIKPCQGDFSCALKNPGECFQKDDMQLLYPKFHNAEIWVLATPLYVSGMTGPLKNLIDRILIPMGEPGLSIRDGRCHHNLREVIKDSKVVLVSNCGYWELDSFDLLIEQIKALCEHAEREFAGALLRPHGPAFSSMIKSQNLEDILEAAREAGRQLIKEGNMNPKTLNIIKRELLPLEMYATPGK
jgi:multimeric flavodoxin WrbA